MTLQHTRDTEQQGRPQGNYLVLRVPNLEASANFYRTIGLELTTEKHGNGPTHYSFPLTSEFICELYPLRQGTSDELSPVVRLGFAVADPLAVRESLCRAGHTVLEGALPGSFVVTDPSGNQVEVSQKRA